MHGTLAIAKDAQPSWFADWSGDVCALVASGPSVTQQAVDTLKGRCRVAVVNNGYQLAPWADLLYAADPKWWDHHPAARAFAGLKVTAKEATAKLYRLHLVSLFGEVDSDDDRIMFDTAGLIGRGGNSAFQLVNLVTQFGCRRQIWVGFDFCGEHWHGKHPEPLKNPRPHTLEKWRRRLDHQARLLSQMDIEVINVSPQSALTAYPKLSLADALSRFGVVHG